MMKVTDNKSRSAGSLYDGLSSKMPNMHQQTRTPPNRSVNDGATRETINDSPTLGPRRA